MRAFFASCGRQRKEEIWRKWCVILFRLPPAWVILQCAYKRAEVICTARWGWACGCPPDDKRPLSRLRFVAWHTHIMGPPTQTELHNPYNHSTGSRRSLFNGFFVLKERRLMFASNAHANFSCEGRWTRVNVINKQAGPFLVWWKFHLCWIDEWHLDGWHSTRKVIHIQWIGLKRRWTQTCPNNKLAQCKWMNTNELEAWRSARVIQAPFMTST